MIQARFLKNQVSATKAFDGLSKIQKILFLKMNNLKQIEHGLNVAKNIGFDKWEKQTNVNYSNKLIIKELLDNEQN